MKPERKNSVCVIDDDEEFTHFVERYLTSIGHTVRAYTAPAAFLADPQALHCDIYLVDLMLPGLDGIEVVSQIRAQGDAGIIVVSGRMGPDAFTTSLVAGADMFINKPVRADQIAQAIASLARRLGTTTAAADLPWRLDRARGVLLAPGGAEVKLGPLEQRILLTLAEAGEAGCTRSDLARLAQVAPSVDDRNLDAAMFRLRRKIEGKTGKASPIVTLHGKGYALATAVTLLDDA